MALGPRNFLTRRAAWPDFVGRNALITGGSRGLGLALAEELASAGARVALLARSEPTLRAAQAQLQRALGRDVAIIACDLRDPSQLERALDGLLAEWGHVDVLVNNAGIIQPGRAEGKPLREYEEAMAVHFWAPLQAMRAVLPGMRRRGGGRIVNVSSIEGRVAFPRIAPYSASKFALTGLSNALRAELAQTSIYVTSVAPCLLRSTAPAGSDASASSALPAWLASLAASALVSTSYAHAARRIARACLRGERWLDLDVATKLLVLADAVAPSAVGALMEIANRALPDE